MTGEITARGGGRTVEGELADGVGRLVVRNLTPGTKPLIVKYAGIEPAPPTVVRSRVDVP